MGDRSGTGVMLAMLLVLLPFPVMPQASPTVEITNRHPVAGDVLAVDQPLYLRISYRSDIPLRFQLRSAGDARLSAFMNPAPVYPAGTGEALVWLAHRKPLYLDSATLLVFDADWQELEVMDVPVRARWGTGGLPPAEPRWVNDLRRQQQEMVRTAAAAANSERGGTWLVPLMALAIPGYLILQFLVWRHWRGGWRIAGLLPVWVAVPLIAYTAALLIAGSNLWPAMLLLLMPLLFLYLVGLSIARSVAGGG